MSLVETLIEWSRSTFMPYGEFGLFSIAFMESSFFPIPPDIILIPLCLLNPELALWYALVTTIGSVLGSLLGYQIGVRGGRPILNKIVSKSTIDKVEEYFKKYGVLGIGAAAFSPIPYKIFTITAGVMKFDIKKMLGVSVLGRGGRFFLEAFLIILFGEAIMNFLINYFEIFTFGLLIMFGLGYAIYRKFFNNS